ncbi:MAG: DNA polymerase III subunit chi [Gammaproteobacteria bacterium]|nr:DNA polymerase III subunit chi [Gammaproteobacteria bacterium]
MTRIDFYLLPHDNEADRLDMVCKLAEKAVRQSKRVFIHTECEKLAASLDSALWHYRDDSFLPHCTLEYTESRENTAGVRKSETAAGAATAVPGSVHPEPVAIGCAAAQPDSQRTVLINLAQEVPPFFSRFERTLEVINQQEDVRDSGRRRYTYYQQRGYPLAHHKLA